MKNTLILIILFFFYGCEKKIDFIELTTSVSQNPAQPRFGIQINSENNLYVCKEVIVENRRSSKFQYYLSNQHIDFEKFKSLFLRNFKNNNITSENTSIQDATFYQIYYNLNNIKYRSTFIESDLNPIQHKIFTELYEFSNNRDMKRIQFHKFSTKLFSTTNLPKHIKTVDRIDFQSMPKK